jgi:hypothetical protein
MKTSNYLIALAALTSFTLVGCSDNDFLGTGSGPETQEAKGEITFATGSQKMTRALEGVQAADKLNRQFIVWGDKHTAGTENGTAANDESVFQNYVVTYAVGTEKTTESNTHGWEYVGNNPYIGTAVSPALDGAPNINQSIKYWDYAVTTGYTFHGISALPSDIGTNLTVTKVRQDPADPSADPSWTLYKKGWDIKFKNSNASLGDIYAADRKPVAYPSSASTTASTEEGQYGSYVKLTFRSMVAKVRFAMYETIPGYDVNIDYFYIGVPANESPATNGDDANFSILTENKFAAPAENTVLHVTYDDGSTVTENENRAIVAVEAASAANNYAKFGTNLNSADKIGTSSPTATYDYSDKAYTYVLPQNVGKMTLYVAYTLTSIDKSSEKIHIKKAFAEIPASYNNWKNNFAYTYIFKISDNTNGSSGTPGTDPAGLYPITFAACVVDEDEDFQETITTVAEPSITTYANGKIVTENDEYKTGTDIYVTVDGATLSSSNSRLFEVKNYGTEDITEETVANYANNYMVLKEVTLKDAPETAENGFVAAVPMSDGNNKTMNALRFSPTAQVYAYQYKDASNKLHYKVIKVDNGTGTTIGVTPTIAYKSGTTAITSQAADVATITMTGVLGAAPLFNHQDRFEYTDNGNGTYSVKLRASAVNSGTANTASDGEPLTFAHNGANKIKVALAYTFDPGTPAVNTGSNVDFTLKTNTTEAVPAKATIVLSNAMKNNGITVKEKAAGQYNVAVPSTATAGTYTATIAGQNVNIIVTAYKFSAPTYTYTVKHDGTLNSPVDFILNMSTNNTDWSQASLSGGTAITAASINKSSTDLTFDLKSETTATYQVNSTVGGTYTVSYEGAKATIVINKYTLSLVTPYTATVVGETGSTQYTLDLNGVDQVPAIANVFIYSGENVVTGTDIKNTNFTTAVNGKKITVASKAGDSKPTAGKYTLIYQDAAGVIVAKTVFTVPAY